MPNDDVYPFQWLWDSCFHAIAWAELGEPDRAVAELSHVFRAQHDSGFVPHVNYEAHPTFHAEFWGREGASSITQPPMYGHAVAELVRRGIEVPSSIVRAARAALAFLFEQRARDDSSGLVTIVHPWESGADDSPRWDHWCDGSFDSGRWYDVKGELVESIVRDREGAALANPAFGAAPVAFNALLVFNARELAEVVVDDSLRVEADALDSAVRARYDSELRTWSDAGPAADTSGRVRTSDALLACFGAPERAATVLDDLVDRRAYGGRYGPTYVHRAEPVFAPRAYWRGAAWPQLTYLLWVCARRAGHHVCDALGRGLVDGATRSGFAEYWDPDDGAPLGARPQSWSALAAVVASERDDGAAATTRRC